LLECQGWRVTYKEVGTIQPIRELAAIAHAAGALFHTDTVQAASKIPVDVQALDVGLLSLSAHKQAPRPQGHGCALRQVEPLIHGGS